MKKRSWTLAFLMLASCSTPLTKNRSTEKAQSTKMPAPQLAPKQSLIKSGPELLLASAQKSYQGKDYAKAFDFYIAAIPGLKGQPRELEAQMGACRSAVRTSKWSETLALSDNAWALPGVSVAQKNELMSYRQKALEATGNYSLLVAQLRVARQDPTLANDSAAYKQRTIELVESRLPQGDLEEIAERDSDPQLKSTAMLRLAEIALENKDYSSARGHLQNSMKWGTGTPSGKRAAELLAQIESMSRVEAKTIGVVLPLTGKHAAIAQKTLRGIQMGLGLYGQNMTNFKLAIVDDEANPEKARQGVERLVREDNVIAIVGSLVSKSAPAVASKASELGVPSLALSQKSGITDLGASVHRNALTSEMQVRYLVEQAMEERGLKKFAILYPNDPYGVEFANLFWDEVLARGGQVTAAQTYSVKETDFRNVIQRLVGTFYVDARADEYRLKMKEWSDNNKTRTARTTIPETLLPPLVDFDAVFIPDSAKSMGQIAAMLSYNDVKGVTLLGTNIWNVPGLAKRAGHFADKMLFVDSFVGSDPQFQQSGFVQEFRSMFGEDPGPFEIQGYDSALILKNLISKGASNREGLSRELSLMKEVPGSLSNLKMLDREVERPLVALTLDNGQVVPATLQTKKRR